MAYLGRGLDKISNIEVLDNITFDGSSSYSITKGSVAFVPNSAQSLLISIDGVVQAANFTVSSSTINFGVAIPSTSTCNFFLHYGTGVMTVPSDGSVTTAKLGDSSVTTAKLDSGVALGKVLQVVTATDTSTRTTNSTSFVTASNTMSVSITPSSTSNKIFITASGNLYNDTSFKYAIATIFRNSTDLGASSNKGLTNLYTGNSDNGVNLSMTILDNPQTTSAITYQVYFRATGGNAMLNENDTKGCITAFEIGS